ncbi:hypothetical protein LSPH24S_09113 [Lysinibacillus sphaericus]
MQSIESIALISEKNAASSEEVTASVDEQQRAIQLISESSDASSRAKFRDFRNLFNVLR